MKFSRRRKLDIDVNLTPLIDVVFLLLIFFMVSTTFIEDTHLVVNLPEATGEQAPPVTEKIEVQISKAGGYTVNDKVLIDTRIETLLQAIREASGGDSRIPMVISADADTSHQAVVRAMDAAGQLGFSKLSITTRNIKR